MDMIKIVFFAIAAVVLGMLVRSVKPEFGVLIGMTACTCIFLLLIHKIELVLEYMNTIWDLLPVDKTSMSMLLKMIGISYIAEFSGDICKDAGYQTMAGQIELFAKVSILLISMPILMSFLELIGEFL
ncbi:MAG: stage III sporulation protein AD [Lachnospiraceae bacterium]|nr:stage III sporulation protein AD [Lachnospiraceae bacterium]